MPELTNHQAQAPLQKSWQLVLKHPRQLPAGGDKVASISGAGFWDFGKEIRGKKKASIWVRKIWNSVKFFHLFIFGFSFPNKKSTKFEVFLLVGGLNPFEKICSSNWIMSKGMVENKNYKKHHPVLDRLRRLSGDMEIHPSASSALMDMLIGLKVVSS